MCRQNIKRLPLPVPIVEYSQGKIGHKLQSIIPIQNHSDQFMSRIVPIRNVTNIVFWINGDLIIPDQEGFAQPNEDLSDDVKVDFLEAGSIVNKSPRGAAALLRLAIQKLCKQLGEPGKDINTDIGSLVKKGLRPSIQKALDIVRVTGNESVHPGVLDMKDNLAVALKLFELVNLIAEVMITEPKRIDQLYEAVIPEEKKSAIAKRDEEKNPTQ